MENETGLDYLNKINDGQRSNVNTIQNEYENITAIKAHKTRQRRGIKLRRLYNVQCHENSFKSKLRKAFKLKKGNVTLQKIDKKHKRFWTWCALAFLMLLTAFAAVQFINSDTAASESNVISDFLSKYTYHYMAIMHDQLNYCERDVDVSELFTILRREVLHQDHALDQLENVLRNQSSAQALLFYGSSGVGKSLTALLLRKHYHWKENVQMYSWNTHVKDELHKFEQIDYMLETLSLCGRNLLIIDNMTPNDLNTIRVLNSMIVQRALSVRAHIIMIYIININKQPQQQQPELEFEQSFGEKFVNELSNDTTLIHYKSFGRHELADCVRNELRLEKINIADNYFDEILDETEIEQSGCKRICSKVLAAIG